MSLSNDRHTPWLGSLLLGIAFLVLVVIGVFTVLMPQMEHNDEAPDAETSDPE